MKEKPKELRLKFICFALICHFGVYMGVSKNRGFPLKSSHFLRRFSIINHPLWGIPIFGNIHIKPKNMYSKNTLLAFFQKSTVTGNLEIQLEMVNIKTSECNKQDSWQDLKFTPLVRSWNVTVHPLATVTWSKFYFKTNGSCWRNTNCLIIFPQKEGM